MFPNNESDNENDSVITFDSNENNYFMRPYLNPSENDIYTFYERNNSESIFCRNNTENIDNFSFSDNFGFFIIPDDLERPNLKFISILKKGRGPKPKLNPDFLEVKRQRHLNTHFDNLQIKIQVHFINFLINLSNDFVFSIFKNKKKYNFKDIDHSFKIDVSRKNSEFLKSSSIKDVLRIKISKKYKQYEENSNEQLLKEVCEKSAWLNNFFNLNYLEVFKCFYYNDQNQMDKISFCGQVISLSEKTQKKTFYELLIKNKNIKKELINAVKNAYFNGKDPNSPMMDENRFESY